MIGLSKAFWTCQIHLTAVMTLIAGMPQLVCACSPNLDRTAIPQPALKISECHCCCSCGSRPTDGDPSVTTPYQTCCSSGSSSQKSQYPGNSPRAKGKGCIKEVMPAKAAGVLSTKTSKPIGAFSESYIATQATLVPSVHIGPVGSYFRWTWHSPGPPGDLVTSLQRLLI